MFQGLKEPGAITMFAPSDEAFSKLPSGAVEFLLDNSSELAKALTFYIVADQKVESSDISNSNSVNTVEGTILKVCTLNEVHMNNFIVIDADIEIGSSVIHDRSGSDSRIF